MVIRVADWAKALTFAISIALAFLFFQAIARVLALLVIAGVVAYLVSPGVRLLSRFIGSRTWAVILAYIAFLVTLGVGIILIAPLISAQAASFARGLPEYTQTAEDLIESLNAYLRKTSLDRYVRLRPQLMVKQAGSQLAAQAGTAFQLVASFVGVLGQMLLVFIISLYVLLTMPALDDWIRRSTSAELGHVYNNFLAFLNNQVGKYLKGILILMSSVGALTGLGLWLVGVPNAFVLGMVAGILEVVSYFGPVLAGIPILIVAITVSPMTAFLALMVIVAVQLLEANTLSPLILGKTVDVSPLVVLLLLLAGAEVAGVIGVALAVPLFIIIRSTQRFIRENFSYVRAETGPDRIVLKRP